jgi:branched-chain amino acid transport system substrate-binding protein
MKRTDNRLAGKNLDRRTVLAGAAAIGALAAPGIARAQTPTIKVGVLHPVTGAIAFSGNQARQGALLAIADINARGGIRSMGGARLEALLADAQSRPDVGAAEVDKLNEAGAVAIVGPFASGIALATTQAAARHNLPHIVDVGVVDQIVTRGLANTFRFGPGIGTIVDTALDSLVRINDQAGKPVKTVMIVHEESAFGTGMATQLNERLPRAGFEVMETIKHANPTRDFSNIVLRIQARRPDLIIPSNYYDEYVLLARALQQNRVQTKGVYSILGGGASSYRFVKEFPQAADLVMDCNHWFDPRKAASLELKTRIEAQGLFFTYEVFLAYSCMLLLADAIERARSTDKAAIIAALGSSTFADHIMPYGPTQFVNGQNQGARPVVTQVQQRDIKLIFPVAFASGTAVFPRPTGRG